MPVMPQQSWILTEQGTQVPCSFNMFKLLIINNLILTYMSQENIKIVNLGYIAYQHKMEIVFKCIQSEIARIDADQKLWKNSKAWNPTFPPAGYERNQAAIMALMHLSKRIRATLELNRLPTVTVEIGE